MHTTGDVITASGIIQEDLESLVGLIRPFPFCKPVSAAPPLTLEFRHSSPALRADQVNGNDAQGSAGVESACGAHSHDLPRLRKGVEAELSSLPALLNEDPFRSRAGIFRHVSEISMTSTRQAAQKCMLLKANGICCPKLPQKAKVTGAMLNGDFQVVAGRGFEPPTFGL
jgi:hypothetical protein